MKDYTNRILKECIKDQVDVDKEWDRLSSILLEDNIQKTETKKQFLSIYQSLKYIAAVFLGVILSFSVFYLMEKESVMISSKYKLVTERGEKSFLQLPDGSKIWMNSCSTLEYDMDYGTENRNIYLNGEAYFEVAKNQQIPFIVKTQGGIDVKALGTAFNVSAYREDAKLITTLFNGKVAVQPTLTKQQVLLEPNQVAIYYKEKNRIEVIPYDHKMYAKWREGFLSFDMMRLEDITKLLERNYNVSFKFNNQQIKKLKFSGSFRNNEDLSELLEVIRINTNIEYEIIKDTVIIK